MKSWRSAARPFVWRRRAEIQSFALTGSGSSGVSCRQERLGFSVFDPGYDVRIAPLLRNSLAASGHHHDMKTAVSMQDTAVCHHGSAFRPSGGEPELHSGSLNVTNRPAFIFPFITDSTSLRVMTGSLISHHFARVIRLDANSLA